MLRPEKGGERASVISFAFPRSTLLNFFPAGNVSRAIFPHLAPNPAQKVRARSSERFLFLPFFTPPRAFFFRSDKCIKYKFGARTQKRQATERLEREEEEMEKPPRAPQKKVFCCYLRGFHLASPLPFPSFFCSAAPPPSNFYLPKICGKAAR